MTCCVDIWQPLDSLDYLFALVGETLLLRFNVPQMFLAWDLCSRKRLSRTPGTLNVLSPSSGTITALRSSVEHKAVAWNRYNSCTIVEISFEPAVICRLPIVLLSTSTKRVALPILSDRYIVLDSSAPSATPDSNPSIVVSVPPDMAAHCFASRFASSAHRRSSWILSTRNNILRGRACFSLSQIALVSPDVSDKNDSHGTKRARCCTAALYQQSVTSLSSSNGF